jgi:hypothetical protein
MRRRDFYKQGAGGNCFGFGTGTESLGDNFYFKTENEVLSEKFACAVFREFGVSRLIFFD